MNQGLRYVHVVRKDFDINKNVTYTHSINPCMKGDIPLSLGDIITRNTIKPTIEIIDHSPSPDTYYSEYWVVGLGLKNIEDALVNTPADIVSIKKPWLETFSYYVLFPVVDLVGGFLTAGAGLLDETYDLLETSLSVTDLGKNGFDYMASLSSDGKTAAAINAYSAIVCLKFFCFK